jgi:hypothetical protein
MGNICGSAVYFSLGEGHSRWPFLFFFLEGERNKDLLGYGKY